MTLFGGETDFFGLDIASNMVRLVKLSDGPDHFSLESFGTAPIPGDLAQSDSKVDLQSLAKIISELTKKAQISTKNVVAAIPGTSVFNAVIKLPAMSKAELEKAVAFQAEQNLPIKLEDAKYDWLIIGQDQTTKEITVMIIAAAKGKIEKMVELFGYADLNVMALETAAVAMARSLSVKTDPLVMILDIGSLITEIAIVDNGILSLTRSFPIAGKAMTRAVSQNLTVDIAQADTFKEKFGLSQDKLEGQVYKAIEPVMKSILDEALRSIKYYEERTGKTINRVILTGGSSRLPLISEYIKSYLNVEIVFGNPWSRVSFQASFSDKLNQIAPEFSTAVGLAMRR